MRDSIAFTLMFACLAAAWGVIRPYFTLRRRYFAGMALGLFIAFVIAVPPQTPEEKAEAAAAVAQASHKQIAAKATEGVQSVVDYTRSENPKTYTLVGAEAFAQLNVLEPGAIYAAAESEACDKVSVGAVSLEKSSKDSPVWFVDCANGNRFMIAVEEATEALERLKTSKLALRDRSPDCNTSNIALCIASAAQKSAKETEIVTFCDMTVEDALISDSDMAWSWNYAFGDGGDIQVVRDFEAQNAFGANLKHRYVCTFDAGTQRIKELIIEGPMGAQRLI